MTDYFKTLKPIVKKKIVADTEEYQLELFCTFDLNGAEIERPYIRVLNENTYCIPTYDGLMKVEFDDSGYMMEYIPNSLVEEETENEEQYIEPEFHYDATAYDDIGIWGHVAIVSKVIDGISYDGIIDSSGKELLPVRFQLWFKRKVFDVNEKMNVVFRHNGLVGLMNLRQEIIIPPKFSYIDEWEQDTFLAHIAGDASHKYFLFTKNGNLIFESSEKDEIPLPHANCIIYYKKKNQVDIYKITYKADFKTSFCHYSDLEPFSEDYKNHLKHITKMKILIKQELNKDNGSVIQ